MLDGGLRGIMNNWGSHVGWGVQGVAWINGGLMLARGGGSKGFLVWPGSRGDCLSGPGARGDCLSYLGARGIDYARGTGATTLPGAKLWRILQKLFLRHINLNVFLIATRS